MLNPVMTALTRSQWTASFTQWALIGAMLSRLPLLLSVPSAEWYQILPVALVDGAFLDVTVCLAGGWLEAAAGSPVAGKLNQRLAARGAG